jgi:hypothetical protein
MVVRRDDVEFDFAVRGGGEDTGVDADLRARARSVTGRERAVGGPKRGGVGARDRGHGSGRDGRVGLSRGPSFFGIGIGMRAGSGMRGQCRGTGADIIGIGNCDRRWQSKYLFGTGTVQLLQRSDNAGLFSST